MKIERIDVDAIVVVSRLRPVNQSAVERLAESMLRLGQLQPISLHRPDRGSPVVVTGVHRFEAAKLLGWKFIDAIFIDGDSIDLELHEIAENLHRTELTRLERDTQVARWAELTAAKVVQSAPPSGGHQPKEKGVRKIAADLGLEKTDVIRAVKVASISEEAKQAARDAGLDDNRTALLQVAKESSPAAQVAKVGEIASAKIDAQARKNTTPTASAAPFNPADPEEVAGIVRALHTSLSALDPIVDKIFEIGLFAFWDAIGSKAAQERFANALKTAGRLARIEDGAPDFSNGALNQ
jgi:ParB family transcriptional regulator, chromosome partitioning protein